MNKKYQIPILHFIVIKLVKDIKKWTLQCGGPSEYIDKFGGKLDKKGSTSAVDFPNFLLRGCSLKNTKWIIGLVVYTGHETKIMLNS